MTSALPRRLPHTATPARGYQIPDGAAFVGAAGLWLNPHPVGRFCALCGPGVLHTAAAAADAYREFLTARPDLVERAREELAGKDLVCWCPLHIPCHADVLLAVANQPPHQEATTPREDRG